jgi:hypothetical protein
MRKNKEPSMAGEWKFILRGSTTIGSEAKQSMPLILFVPGALGGVSS